jgi:hypothetical protein
MSIFINKFSISSIGIILFAMYLWVLFSYRDNPSLAVVTLLDFIGIVIGYATLIFLMKAYTSSGGYFKKIIFWESLATLIAIILLFTFSIFEFYFTTSLQYFSLVSPVAVFGVCVSIMLTWFWFCRITFSNIFEARRLWLYGILNTALLLSLSTRFLDDRSLFEIYQILFYGLSLMVISTVLILVLNSFYESGRAYIRLISLHLIIVVSIFFFLISKIFLSDTSQVLVEGRENFQQAIEVIVITFVFLISINLHRLEVFSLHNRVSKK